MYVKTQWVDNTTPIDKNNLNKIESGIKNNDINIGEENYDNTKTYEVGDIVRYNEKIYKCITAITTAENFDISKWEQTNIVEIVQSEKSKIYELIEALSTPIVGEGENITLNDTAEKRFENFDIEGNSEQETRSGKNYLNTLAKYKAGEKVTVDGITYIFNEDGSITCNGTATADSVLTFSSNLQTINGSGKKIVGMITGTQVPAKLSILAYTSDWSKNTFELLSSVNKNITINMQENIDYAIFRIIAYKGTTLNNQTIYYQILDTSVNDLTYEQYGASPSLNYPSEVKCVGSNVNIFDKDNPDMFLNGLTPDNSGNIVSTLTDTTKTNYIITIIVPCKGNKQYTISRWLSGKTFIVYESEKNKFNINDKVTLLKRNDNSGIINETIATSANAKYILVKIYSTWGNEENTYNDLISSIKIEKGKVATPWSPYGMGCVNEKVQNKNLWNVTITPKRYVSKTTGVIGTSVDWSASDFILIKGNTDYVYSGVTNSYSTVAGTAFYDKNKEFISTISSNVYSFKTPVNAQYVRISLNTENPENIQLEQGTTATDYVAHEEQDYSIPVQQPMRAIRNVRDKFILKENGKWYERHYINRIIFNGLEDDFTVRNSGDEKTTYSFNYGITNVKNFGKEYIVSNMFTYNQTSTNGKEGIGIPDNLENQIYFQIKRSRLSDISSSSEALNSFKNYLKELYNSNNPLYVDYVLEEPLDIECTSEQTEILNQIYIKAKSYKGITHIYSNDEVSPNCYVEAVKDLTTLIQ